MYYLLAIDDSPNARTCVQTLAAMKLRPESTIHVLSVWDEEMKAMPHRLSRKDAESLVQQAVSDLKKVHGDAVNGEAVFGNVVETILKKIESLKIGNTLVGGHSKTGLNDFLLGNVASAVVRRSKSSVTIVKRRSDGDFVLPQRHLVCVDSSALANVVLASLDSRFWLPGSEVRLLHVLEPDTSAESEDPHRDAELCVERQAEARAKMQELIDSQIESMKKSYPDLAVSGEIVEELDATRGILQAAKSFKADLIVIGSHGRAGIERMLLGSVSEEVAAKAKCSVEVLR